MNAVSNTPFWLSVVSCVCLVCCFVLVAVAFRSKVPATLFIGVVLGIAGFIMAVVSSVKAVHLLKMVEQDANLQGAKKMPVITLALNSVYALVIVALLLFVFRIFTGYINGF